MKDSKKYHFTRSFLENCRKNFISTHRQFVRASRLSGDELDMEFTAWFGERWKLEGELERECYIVSKVGQNGYFKSDRKECQAFILAEKERSAPAQEYITKDTTDSEEC